MRADTLNRIISFEARDIVHDAFNKSVIARDDHAPFPELRHPMGYHPAVIYGEYAYMLTHDDWHADLYRKWFTGLDELLEPVIDYCILHNCSAADADYYDKASERIQMLLRPTWLKFTDRESMYSEKARLRAELIEALIQRSANTANWEAAWDSWHNEVKEIEAEADDYYRAEARKVAAWKKSLK